MGTEPSDPIARMHAALDDPDWARVLDGIRVAETWLRAAEPGDPQSGTVVSKLSGLAGHTKWEIRRAVANTAAQVPQREFETALARLATDDNGRVRQAAELASMRRRDWQNASALGRQHEDRINAALDDIEARFGQRGREAVKRAAGQMANTFARELYHEVIKLVAPLASSVDRLGVQLTKESVSREELADEAGRIGRRVVQLRAILDGMRAYTAQPKLEFARVRLKDVFDEAALLVRESNAGRKTPAIELHVEADATAEVIRDRLVQALNNLLTNAMEAYDGMDTLEPIITTVTGEAGRIVITIEDRGCGMSTEVLSDAPVLFSTSKPNGTGFGLPLAIKIVESEHGGRLTIESMKGRGTKIRIVIPTVRSGERT